MMEYHSAPNTADTYYDMPKLSCKYSNSMKK